MNIHQAVNELANQDHQEKLESAKYRDIHGGRRCAITACNGLNDGNEPEGWWVGYSPRNGMGASVEGEWEDWVKLAKAIIEEDTRRKAAANVV